MWSTILNETVTTSDHLDKKYNDHISTRTREIKSILVKSHYALRQEIVLKLQGFKGYSSSQNRCEGTSEINDIFDAHYLVIERIMTELVDYMQDQMLHKMSLLRKYCDGILAIRDQDSVDDDDDCVIISPQEIAVSSIPSLEIIPETVINQEIQSMESDDNSPKSQYESPTLHHTETQQLPIPSIPILEHGPEIATNQEVPLMESYIDPDYAEDRISPDLGVQSSECGEDVSFQSEHVNHCNRSNVVDLKVLYKPGETLKCNECNQLFQNHSEFIDHMDAEHGIKKPYQCSDCVKCYGTKGHLAIHIKNVHAPRFECAVCHKRCGFQSQLTQHYVIHSDERPFECSQCDSSFKVKGDLTKHVRMVHHKEKRYHCDYCSKGFFKKNALIIHLRVHTGERPFQCTECGKAFSAKCTLTNHKRLHTGEKPYECLKCHKAFSTSSHMKNHEKKCKH